MGKIHNTCKKLANMGIITISYYRTQQRLESNWQSLCRDKAIYTYIRTFYIHVFHYH